jgi:predicted ATPase
MGYNYSQLDKDNIKCFQNNSAHNSLKQIILETGHIRSLNHFNIEFKYPISVIAGINGSGKSTLLAIAACAYNNEIKFGGLFQKTRAESPVFSSDTKITYYFVGQDRAISLSKKKASKWTKYSKRPSRQVNRSIISRIIPPDENSTLRNYSSIFQKKTITQDLKDKIQSYYTKIFNRECQDLQNMTHPKYEQHKIPLLKQVDKEYSGFNMGTGEVAVFKILESLFIGNKPLVLIDEIELGLHPEAQKRLIGVLKEICKEYQTQIICTTHSKIILDSLPPEARFFIEKQAQQTRVIPGITPEYAFGLLSGSNSKEMQIFVEDEMAKKILINILAQEQRERICIFSIGNHDAICDAIVYCIKTENYNFLAIFDGDQQTNREGFIKNILKKISQSNNFNEDSIGESILFFPSNQAPEKYILEKISNNESAKHSLAENFKINKAKFEDLLNEVQKGNHHDFFYNLAQKLHLDNDRVITDFIKAIEHNEFKGIIESITKKLQK